MVEILGERPEYNYCTKVLILRIFNAIVDSEALQNIIVIPNQVA